MHSNLSQVPICLTTQIQICLKPNLPFNNGLNEAHKGIWVCMEFPGGTSGKEPACQCRRHEGRGFDPWIWKIPWRRKWQRTPVFLPGESHGQRSLAGYSPWGQKDLHGHS